MVLSRKKKKKKKTINKWTKDLNRFLTKELKTTWQIYHQGNAI